MTLELTGKLIVVDATQQVSDKFKKREFVLETVENNYTNYAKFQLTQNKCDLIDSYSVGSQLKVSFNVKGNKYERHAKTMYFTTLEAWRIESVGVAPSQTTTAVPLGGTTNNVAADQNLPF